MLNYLINMINHSTATILWIWLYGQFVNPICIHNLWGDFKDPMGCKVMGSIHGSWFSFAILHLGSWREIVHQVFCNAWPNSLLSITMRGLFIQAHDTTFDNLTTNWTMFLVLVFHSHKWHMQCKKYPNNY